MKKRRKAKKQERDAGQAFMDLPFELRVTADEHVFTPEQRRFLQGKALGFREIESRNSK